MVCTYNTVSLCEVDFSFLELTMHEIANRVDYGTRTSKQLRSPPTLGITMFSTHVPHPIDQISNT